MAAPALDQKFISWNDKISNKIFHGGLPAPTRKICYISNFLFLISLAAVIPILVTCWNVYKTEDAGGLVLWAVIFGVFISIVWLVYGFVVIKNFIVILSSIFLILAKALLTYLTWKYKKDDDHDEKKCK